MTTSPHGPSPQQVLCVHADIGLEDVTALISHSALSARYGAFDDTSGMQAVIAEHRSEIDAAVARKLRSGCRQPIVLRASDLYRTLVPEDAPELAVEASV